MPHLETFRAVASASPEAALTLTQAGGQMGAVSLSHHAAPPASPKNRAVTGRFIEALRLTYGREVGSEVVKITGLDGNLSQGRPLIGRTVVQALDEAVYLLERNRWITSASAEVLSDLSPTENLLDSLRLKARERACELYPGLTDVCHYVNFFALSDKVRSAIIAAGKDGAHGVSDQESAAIRRQILDRELETAYAVKQRNALPSAPRRGFRLAPEGGGSRRHADCATISDPSEKHGRP